MSGIKTQYIIIYIFFCGILLSSCGNELPPKEYAAWVENASNGLTVKKITDKFQFTLYYRPIEYLVALQLRRPEIPADVLAMETEKMKGMQYYTFRISTVSGKPVFSGNEFNFPEKSIYLTSEMAKDFFLLEGKDTLACNLFHFENANGVVPYDNCVLAFEKMPDPVKDKLFLFKADKLKMDWVKMEIKASDINKIPKLKTI